MRPRQRAAVLAAVVVASGASGLFAGPSHAQGSTAVTTEPSDAAGDFPGSYLNGASTAGVVRPGTTSSGHLTEDLDTGHGTTGDYWRLELPGGRSYRLQLTIPGGSLSAGRGGRLGYGFEHTDGTISHYGDGDDFRDDGLAYVHVSGGSRRYFAKVSARDLLNGDESRVYNGPYELDLTDITGTELMVENTYTDDDDDTDTSETITTSDNVKERTSTTSVGRRFSTTITTGSHTHGYVIDRFRVLLEADSHRSKRPFVALYASADPPNVRSSGLPLCRTDRIFNFRREAHFEADTVYGVTMPATDCADNAFAASTTYTVVFHTDAALAEHQLSLTDGDGQYDYGSGWTIGDSARVQATTGSWGDVSDSRVPRFKIYARELPAGGL
ncbi:hypothetical protein [Candidatus Poriferisodalis sp.]|uniref:hypothetical protein n=1 Tax=Candidatus Poriferisodalis sp. TaxID=3101277 RepID=UPI003B01514D